MVRRRVRDSDPRRVFLSAVPVGIVAFGLAFLLPEVRLRTATRTTDTGEAFGIPTARTSLRSCRLRCLATSAARTDCGRSSWLARRAGVDLEPGETWMLQPSCTRHIPPDRRHGSEIEDPDRPGT